MATFALRPTFQLRPQSGSKRRDRGQVITAPHVRPSRWRVIAATIGSIAATFFVVFAPMIGNPAGRLYALEATPTIDTADSSDDDFATNRAFEFTPTMLGPAITEEMLDVTEDAAATEADDDESVVRMPQLDVGAAPPVPGESNSPRG